MKCKCHDLELPRWDIYICEDCGRKLAGFEPYEDANFERFFKVAKYVILALSLSFIGVFGYILVTDIPTEEKLKTYCER